MGDRVKIKLVSTGTKEDGVRTGYYKTTTVSVKPKRGVKPGKLEKKCFDPRAYNKATGKLGMHVIFKQDKIKS